MKLQFGTVNLGCHWLFISQCKLKLALVMKRDVNSPFALAGKQPVAPYAVNLQFWQFPTA